MAASKLVLFGATLLRSHSNKASLTPFGSKSLRFCSVSAVGAAVDLSTDRHHPWPEWVRLVDKLRSSGYFLPPAPSEGAEVSDAVEDVVSYTEMNLLKGPCISFARDRYDVFKSLSTSDIQTVVEHGCPNLLRKAVNSAKRLRAYVQVDEADACSSCNLRGSCDRAYVTQQYSEATARTVDIVRILLFYALDPLVVSGGQKPPGRELVESSARKLLTELIELSETYPNPELPKPAATPPQSRKPSVKFVDVDMVKGVASKRLIPGDAIVGDISPDIEIKRGDWMCPKCNFLNFAKNLRCLRCKEDGPKRVQMDEFDLKKGDWICQKCDFVNFSRNTSCLKCKAEGPKRVGVDEVVKKKGDWNCPQCSFMNFASNRKCLRCDESRPERPGIWECPLCYYSNYDRNKVCRKCNGKRPEEIMHLFNEKVTRIKEDDNSKW